MNVNWDALWFNIFGRTEWHGIAMGFWVGMIIVAVVVVLMNIIEWNFKKFDYEEHHKKEMEQLRRQQDTQKKHDRLREEHKEMYK